MLNQKPIVCIIDDDPAVRTSIEVLLGSVQLKNRSFGSATEFMKSYTAADPCILIVDLRMPGMSGMELQSALAKRAFPPPMIFITAHGDVPSAVRAMKAGAVDFLEKPFSPQVLLDLISRAFNIELESRKKYFEAVGAKNRLRELSRREREVLHLIAQGLSNRETALRLNIAQNTVENHRAKIVKKTGAGHVIELANLLKLEGESSPSLI
jgi:FixJ family two-component response regulator